MNKVMKYIAYGAGTLFIILGGLFIFSDLLPPYLPNQLKILFGIVFILYGVYRISYTLYRSRKADE